MPLEVIGAGASRTGTLSLKLALEELGFGPCHHFFELLKDERGWPRWTRVADGEDVDWDEVYQGYRSGVDAPTCWFYKQLAERYPNAKVILTLRSPDSWLKSAQATIASQGNFERLMATPAASVITKVAAFMARSDATLDPSLAVRDPAAALAGFKRHNEEVRNTIAPERLLVYEVREGWGALCAFLGVPVPQTPFPRANSNESFQDWIRTGRAPI